MTKSFIEDIHWFNGNLRKSRFRQWEVQPPPYRAPLSFLYEEHECTDYLDNIPTEGHPYPPAVAISGYYPDAQLISAAYDDMLSSISSGTGVNSGGWGENLAEAKESLSMVTSRILQVARFTNSIRKVRFGDAAKALGIGVPSGIHKSWKRDQQGNWSPRRGSKWRGRAKGLGDAWLEYHFGWQPLVQDIHDGLQNASKSDFGSHRVHGKRQLDTGGYTVNHVDDGGHALDQWEVSATFKMAADVHISNGNAFLANRMGLVNPVSVAWNLIPFSFVVDWFGNVGQVINSMTDFVGLDVRNAYSTSFQKHKRHQRFIGYQPVRYGPEPWQEYYLLTASNHRTVYCSRVPRVVSPPLTLYKFKGFGLTRAATAISLCLQGIKSL